MNLANTIRMMAEKKDNPPFDVSKADYAGAAKELTQYAKTKGGMDKNDFLAFANRMSAIASKKSPRVTSKFARDLMDLDTSPREKIVSVMRNNGIKVTVQGGGFKIEDFTLEELEELDELEEAVLSGRDYKVKDGKVHISQANFKKVSKDYKNDTKGKERMTVLDPKTQATVSMPVVFEEVELDEAYKTPAEAKAYEDGKKAVAKKVSYDDNPNKKGTKEYTAWSKGHNDARAKMIGNRFSKEEVELEEANRDPSKSGGSGYDLYHKDFSSAMKHAYDYAKKKFGIEIDPKEIDDKVASGPRKPSAGKTNSYRLKGKDGKKGVQIQVANLDNKKYELNMYKESVELDENIDPTLQIFGAMLGMGMSLPVVAMSLAMLDHQTDGKVSAALEKTVNAVTSKFKKNKNYKPTSAEMNAVNKLEKEIKTNNPSIFKKAMAKVSQIKSKKESVEMELDEAMRVLATKGKTKVVTKGDGVALVMVGNKEVASGDLDDGAGGWFMSKKGEKGSKFFDSPKKIADYYAEEVEMNEEQTNELFESVFEELEEATYQVDIKGAGRETVTAKNEKDAIAKASKKMKVHSFKSSDVTVKLVEEVKETMSLEDTLRAIWEGKSINKEDNTNV